MVVLLAVLVGWLASAPPAWAQAMRIACIGDSITYGAGLPDRTHQSWPAVLGQRLGDDFLVENFGVSGTTMLRHGDSPYWNTQSFRDSTNFGPDIVIIMLGTNDTKPWNWQYGDEFEGDYLDMIAYYANLPTMPQVYICAPPPVTGPNVFSISRKVMHWDIVPQVRQVGAEAGVTVINVFRALRGHPEWLPDTVHPNADGQAAIAATVYAVLAGG
jgi:lysophospholipase L1-like esterase